MTRYVCSIVGIAIISFALATVRTAAQQPHPVRPLHHLTGEPAGCPSVQSADCAVDAQSVEAVWRDADVGSPRVPGASAWTGGMVAVAGTGAGLGPDSDEFHFTWTPIVGDVDITARLVLIADRHPLASAGIMIRASFDPDAPYGAVFGGRAKSVGFQRRVAKGWASTAIPSDVRPDHAWLRLVRRGPVVTALISADGLGWLALGEETIDLGDEVYVGFAVSSHRPKAVSTAVFDSVVLCRCVAAVPADAVPDAEPPGPGLPAELPDTGGGDAGTVDVGGADAGASTPPPATPETPDAPASDVGATPATPSVPSDGSVADTPVVPVETARSLPQFLVFDPSVDHDGSVIGYVIEVMTPAMAGDAAVRLDVGKPAVIDGECRVDVGAILQQLTPGTYVAVVRAVNAFGMSDGAVSAPFTI